MQFIGTLHCDIVLMQSIGTLHSDLVPIAIHKYSTYRHSAYVIHRYLLYTSISNWRKEFCTIGPPDWLRLTQHPLSFIFDRNLLNKYRMARRRRAAVSQKEFRLKLFFRRFKSTPFDGIICGSVNDAIKRLKTNFEGIFKCSFTVKKSSFFVHVPTIHNTYKP